MELVLGLALIPVCVLLVLGALAIRGLWDIINGVER